MSVNEKWAKSLASRQNRRWKQQTGQFRITLDDRKEMIAQEDFKSMFDEAYANKGSKFRDVGISYRTNPLTGENEMFVAGSSGFFDWAFNISNGVAYTAEKYAATPLDMLYGVSTLKKNERPKLSGKNPDRRRQELGISRMARKHNIDVMYGHSRGGALVADASFSGTKFGLDAAMVIAQNQDMYNFRRPGAFDALLGLGGTKNEIVQSGRSIHWAYGPS